MLNAVILIVAAPKIEEKCLKKKPTWPKSTFLSLSLQNFFFISTNRLRHIQSGDTESVDI